MTYRVGWPFWQAFARRGVTLTLRVHVMRDEEVGVYVATSPDLQGLVAEAETLDELATNVKAAAVDLLEGELKSPEIKPPRTALLLNGDACHA